MVTHQVVLRVYLAALLGLSLSRAREVRLANASLSIITRDAGNLTVLALDDTSHLANLSPHATRGAAIVERLKLRLPLLAATVAGDGFLLLYLGGIAEQDRSQGAGGGSAVDQTAEALFGQVAAMEGVEDRLLARAPLSSYPTCFTCRVSLDEFVSY